MNTPTKITMVRFFGLVPLFIITAFWRFPYAQIITAAIYGLCVVTDILDGYLARKNNQVTDLGKFLDPIADKICVAAALIIVVHYDILPAFSGPLVLILILFREFSISGFRQIAASKNMVLAADVWGKIKASVTNLALVFLLVQIPNDYFSIEETFGSGFNSFLIWSGYIITICAVALTIMSGVNYMLKNKQVFGAVKEEQTKENSISEE